MGLGVLEDRGAVAADQVVPDGQQSGYQIDVLPGEGDQLATPAPVMKVSQDKCAPVRILLPGGVGDFGRFPC
jgi:hypothetical protein